MIEEFLYTTYYACAWIKVKDNIIIDSASIYKKMIGWNIMNLKGKLEKLNKGKLEK